jgi:L-threonylcarbamoyladenylate synthase
VRLREGALAIYPTDTLYAAGCCALDEAAVSLLREAKGRDERKPFPVIVADVEQARSLCASWSDTAQRLADAFWPGPMTLVLPASPHLPGALLAGALGVAVRVPACDTARTLARLAGPLVSTSANLAGEAPCTTIDLALSAFPIATLAFDIGPLHGTPSTLVDVTAPTGGFRILREGRIDAATLERRSGEIERGRDDFKV